VVGPTGVWVVESGQRRRRLAVGGSDGAPAATLRGLRGQAGAIAEVLDGSAGNSVRGVLCRQGGGSGPPRSLQDIWVAGPRQLADVVRHGSKLAPGEVELATARLLAVLRPAA
jgi:hypothetical protein